MPCHVSLKRGLPIPQSGFVAVLQRNVLLGDAKINKKGG